MFALEEHHLTRHESKQQDDSRINKEMCCAYSVQDEDAGFALRGDEEAEQSLVTLTVMIQVHVANTP